MKMNNFKRLHIVSVLSEFLKGIRRVIIPAIIAYYIGGKSEQAFFEFEYSKLIILVCLFVSILYGLYRYYTFKYKIEKNGVHIKKGIFIKSDTYISKEKIKGFERSRAIIPRIFGLVQIRIKVEGIEDNNPVINLIAISKEEAIDIQDELFEESITQSVKKSEVPPTSISLSKKSIFLSALTSNNLVPSCITVIVIYYQFNSYLNERIGVPTIELLKNSSLVSIFSWISVVILIAWILSIVQTIIRFGSFSLSRNNGRINITQGIFEKKEMMIKIEDIRAIKIEENIFRQPFGFACIYLESSSGTEGKAGVSTILHPFLKVNDIPLFLQSFSLPSPSLIPMHKLPNISKYRYVVRNTIIGCVIGITLAAFLQFKISLILPFLIVYSFWGYLSYKDSAYGFLGSHFLLRHRHLHKKTIIFNRKHIETIYFYQSNMQRRSKVLSIKLTILSNISKKRFKLVGISDAHKKAIHDWYRKK